MRYRFIEQREPLQDFTVWWTEERRWWGWCYISGSMSYKKNEALERFERVKRLGSKMRTQVLSEVCVSREPQ